MKRKILNFLAARLAPLLIIILGKLARIRLVGREHLDGLRESGESFIFAVWHGRMLLPIFLHRKEGIRALVSMHRDGELIARAIDRIGYALFRGSSTRGGGKAFQEMVSHLSRDKSSVAIIPDGPTGPAGVLKPGLITLAQRTGVSILPLSSASKPSRVLKSWDRHMIPLPFAKAVVMYGEPIRIPPGGSDEEREKYRKQVEDVMNELVGKADAFMGLKREDA